MSRFHPSGGNNRSRSPGRWRGMTAVVEQYLDFVRVFGQYFHIMNRGRIAYAGQRAMLTPDTVSHHLSD